MLHVAQPVDGGVGRYVADAAADQLARGWDVLVACPPTGRLPEALAAAGVPVLPWVAGRSPGAASSAETVRLAGLVAAARPDVVHLHSAKAGLAGRLALRGRRRTLFQPHGWSWLATTGSTAAATLRWERVAAARWTDALVCVGEGEAAEGRAHRIPGEYAVVRNGVDLTRFAPADAGAARALLGLPAGPVVVCVGRLTRQKGQDLLLAAWPAVTAAHPGATLALVGGGDLLDGVAVPAGVVLVGDVADVRPWYAAADLLVQPSRWEGLPLTLLEALASGRPVVATAVPGLRDVLPPEAGALVPAGNAAALAGAITARLGDPALLAAESAAAARVAARFDLRRTLGELATLTERTAAGPPAVPRPRRPSYRHAPAVDAVFAPAEDGTAPVHLPFADGLVPVPRGRS